MNPKELFSDALTFPRHEFDDIHYIGEALPAPSQITDIVDSTSSVGGSGIPAREDHQHAVDLTDYYTKAEADTIHDNMVSGSADLTNYYTKAESDARYYTQSAIDAAFAALDFYTQAEVDALIAGAGGSGTKQLYFSWPGLYAPGADFYSTKVRIAEATGGIVSRVRIIADEADPSTAIDIGIYINSVLVYTAILSATSTYVGYAGTLFTDDEITDDTVPIQILWNDSPNGLAENITVIIDYEV